MKIRIASSLALAAALALGATGCSLIAPVATTHPYAPSDGIDVSVEGVDVRNLMLIADETGENFNVVFGAVNLGSAPKNLSITFKGEGSQTASADFVIPTGNSLFGNPAGEETPVLVSLDNLMPGSTITAFVQAEGSDELERKVPVLDGTLKEYQDYVLPADFSSADVSEADKQLEEADEEASEPLVNDDKKAEETEAN